MAAPKLSFAAKVFMSLIAGAICGLFFGEKAQILAPIGTIFIKLMQVSVLPSVVIFIITGIGSINKDDAKEFLKKAALIMLLIWILGIIGFHFMQFAFPNVPSASFLALPSSPGQKIQISLSYLYHPILLNPSRKDSCQESSYSVCCSDLL